MISLGTVKAWLGITGTAEDVVLTLLEVQAVARLEMEARRTWPVPAVTRVDIRSLPSVAGGLGGDAPEYLCTYLDYAPSPLTSIELRSGSTWSDITDECSSSGIKVELPGVYEGRTVRITYDYGFADEASLPAAVTSTVLALVRWGYDQRARGGVEEAWSGQGVKTVFQISLPSDIQAAIDALKAPPAVA